MVDDDSLHDHNMQKLSLFHKSHVQRRRFVIKEHLQPIYVFLNSKVLFKSALKTNRSESRRGEKVWKYLLKILHLYLK